MAAEIKQPFVRIVLQKELEATWDQVQILAHLEGDNWPSQALALFWTEKGSTRSQSDIILSLRYSQS